MVFTPSITNEAIFTILDFVRGGLNYVAPIAGMTIFLSSPDILAIVDPGEPA